MEYLYRHRILGTTLLYLAIFWVNVSYADTVEENLQEYNRKNLLSQKTIDENKGHLVLFTREKLEKMHAKTLKDVFKTTPAIYYNENRYALPDPLTGGLFDPYNSNFIRLYIDGVEITQGWMGSGIMLYGDVNIDFVDHIEFYYMTPSYETSVEPAYLTVFLYSKDPQRDSGGKLNLVQGNRGYNAQTLSYGQKTDNLTYMVNVSHTHAKRETINNGTSKPLSRDFQRTQLFSYVKTREQTFHLQVMKKNTDGLAGVSLDATPLESQINYLNIHMDYGIKLSENWQAQFTYEWLNVDMLQVDDNPLGWPDALGAEHFDGTYKNSTYTAELTYKETIGDHRFAAGVKGRYKILDSFEEGGKDALVTPFTSEKIVSVFFQDQYALQMNQLLTFAASYNAISRNRGAVDDSLLQLRLGYLYSSEFWSYKTYLFSTQFGLEPFLRYLDLPKYKDVKAQTTVGMTHEISYTDKKQYVRLFLHLMQDEESLLQYKTNASNGNTKYLTTIFNYDYTFNKNNELNIQFYYAQYQDIFDLDKLEDISGYFSWMNTYEDLDFYNGLVWHKNSLDWKNYFDWTSTVTWNLNQALTLTLKGENLLGKAKETMLPRLDFATGNLLSPLSISPIDQRITIELEYIF